MDQPITPHVDLDPQPPIPLVVVYGAFPINSEDEKKMANQRQLEPNVVLSSLFIPYYFLVSFDKLSFSPLAFSRKKDPIDWLILSLEKSRKKSCENDFISLQKVKICQQEILPNC